MEIVGRIRAGDNVSALAVGAGSIWVAVADDDMLKIDPTTDRVIARIGHGDAQLPGGAVRIAILGSNVWSAVPVGTSPPGGFLPDEEPQPDVRTVYERFRPREADMLKVETTGGIVRMDAGSNTVVELMLFLDTAPESIAVTTGGVWVSSKLGVRRLDPDTYRFDEPIDGTAGSLVAGTDSLWAASSTRVVRLDPITGAPKLTITARDLSVEKINTIAADEGSLWVSSGREILTVDAAQGDVLARAPLDDAWEIAAANGALVAVSGFGSTLHQLDPATLAIRGSLDLGGIYVDGGGLVIDDGHAWVAHRARVLKVALA